MTNEQAYCDIANYLGNGCHNGENALSFLTLTTALEAIGKQIPKKPEKNDWGEQTDVCPDCHSYLDTFQVYCPECGQMIDWE